MPTPEQDAASKLYSSLMNEIRVRIGQVDCCTGGHTPLLPPFVKEFCYLQFRMMCELLALGCLAAHGDLKGTKKNHLDKLWAADKIIDELTKLHPDFYPVAIDRFPTADGFHIEPKKDQPLIKEELVRLYI